MAVTKLPENQLYKPLITAATNIGRSLPPRKSKAVDTGRYKNLQNIGARAGNQAGASALNKLGTITTPYGGSTRYEGNHPAVDYVVPGDIGGQVVAPANLSGTVTQVRTGQVQGGPDFGNYVIVKDAQGNSWRFSHLANNYVQVGSQVTPGTVLGAQGNTGQTYSRSGGSGAHTDLRIRDLYNKYVNPSNLIGTNT